jgi:hypothetical protein
MTEKWEYKRISAMRGTPRHYDPDLEINALGAAGWELVTHSQGFYTLKRRRND